MGEGASRLCRPITGRRSLGELLCALPKTPPAAGVKRLHLDASTNARSFYERHGYTATAEGFHTLASGARMRCVHMQKYVEL